MTFTMAAITFVSKLKEDASLTIPREAVEELGLRPGDEVQLQVKTKNGTSQIEEPDQDALQAKFDRFFDDLDTLTFEKPVPFSNGDQTETAFREIMKGAENDVDVGTRARDRSDIARRSEEAGNDTGIVGSESPA